MALDCGRKYMENVQRRKKSQTLLGGTRQRYYPLCHQGVLPDNGDTLYTYSSKFPEFVSQCPVLQGSFLISASQCYIYLTIHSDIGRIRTFLHSTDIIKPFPEDRRLDGRRLRVWCPLNEHCCQYGGSREDCPDTLLTSVPSPVRH